MKCKKRILIIDDSKDMILSLSSLLENIGYEPVGVQSPNEAIKKVSSENFDVVLLDLVMPGIDGIEVLQRLKKLRPDTKVVMMSAFATVDGVAEAMKKGASDYLSKPFAPGKLCATINRIVEESRFEHEIAAGLDIENAITAVANSIRRNAISLLNIKKSLRLMEIANQLAIDDHTKLVFHLKALQGMGIVEKDEERRYELTKKGKKVAECIWMLKKFYANSEETSQGSHNS